MTTTANYEACLNAPLLTAAQEAEIAAEVKAARATARRLRPRGEALTAERDALHAQRREIRLARNAGTIAPEEAAAQIAPITAKYNAVDEELGRVAAELYDAEQAIEMMTSDEYRAEYAEAAACRAVHEANELARKEMAAQ